MYRVLSSRSIAVAFLLAVSDKAAFCQSRFSPDVVRVSLQVFRNTRIQSDSTIGYFGVVTITNTQDTAIEFPVMSCGWRGGSFISDDSLSFDTDIGCDSNFPWFIKLGAGRSVTFSGVMYSNSLISEGKLARIGFKLYSNLQDFKSSLGIYFYKDKYSTVCWSNKVWIHKDIKYYGFREN